MGMRIDEARGDDEVGRVDLTARGVGHAADFGDASVGDRDVSAITRCAGPVDYGGILYEQIVQHGRPPAASAP